MENEPNSHSESPADAGIVIVGSGLAGYTLAREWRKRDKAVPVTVVTRDHGGFYSKPMLSNGYGSGRPVAGLVTSTAEAMASQLGITVSARTEVRAIDRAARVLHTDQGAIPYRQLVLALGADPIRLPIGGDAADRVLSVNDWDDYARFRAAADPAQHVLVIGAGLIGCEFANDLCLGGKAVALVDVAERPLGRLLPPIAADRLRSALAQSGVSWHLGTQVVRVDAAGDRLAVTLADGTTIATDLVLSAVGLRPRTALAGAAGLATGRGITVDRHLATSDPAIFALGDCAEVEGLVLPYVMPLMQGARALARTLGGEINELEYPAMPVVVKTPALPTVVAPPVHPGAGEWVEQADESGVLARWMSPEGRMLGFALVGVATAQKTALARELPNWL